MAQLAEEIGELEFRRNGIVCGFGKEGENKMSAIPKRIKETKANIDMLNKLKARFTGDIEKADQEFDQLRENAIQFDLYELTAARLALRPKQETEARESMRTDLAVYRTRANETDARNHEKTGTRHERCSYHPRVP